MSNTLITFHPEFLVCMDTQSAVYLGWLIRKYHQQTCLEDNCEIDGAGDPSDHIIHIRSSGSKEEYFQSSPKEPLAELKITKPQERKMIKLFVSLGILKTKLFGLPAKRYLSFDFDRLRQIRIEAAEQEESDS